MCMISTGQFLTPFLIFLAAFWVFFRTKIRAEVFQKSKDCCLVVDGRSVMREKYC
jgi:hypothetical protein